MKMRRLCSVLLLFSMILSTLVSCGIAGAVAKGIVDPADYPNDALAQDVYTGGEKLGAFRVLSFNIQGNKTNASNRKNAIVQEIVTYSPDFFGFQEDGGDWYDTYGLKSALEAQGYAMAYDSSSFSGGYSDVSNAIFYKTNNGYTIVESGARWLSSDGTKKIASTIDDIPQEMRQAFIDAGYPMSSTADLTKPINNYVINADGETASQSALLGARMMTWALIEDADGNQFVYVNTHLQHRSNDGYTVPIWGIREIERINQWRYLVSYINSKYPGVPTVVTGDMNEIFGKPSYCAYVEEFDDTARLAKIYRGTNGTWNNFYTSDGIGKVYTSNDTQSRKVGYSTSALDLCLVTPNKFTIEQFQVGDGVYAMTDGSGYVATSDHKAIIVDLRLGVEDAPIPLQKPGAERSPVSYYSGTIDTDWYDPNNVKSSYTLTTADQLMGFMELRTQSSNNFDGVTIKLGANMVINELKDGVTEFTSPSDWKTNHAWTTLNSSYYFEGVFDGQGHYISGVRLTAGGSGAKGLLGGVGDCEIKNFSVVNSYYTTTTAVKNRIGAIAARVKNGGDASFYNIESDIIMTTPASGAQQCDKLGGILGHVEGNSTVTFDYCTFSGTIDVNKVGGTMIGGIVGSIDSASAKVDIVRCKNEGTLIGGDMVGGMVGYISVASRFNLSSSAMLGKIDALRFSGGLIGTVHQCHDFFVSNCVVNADLDFSRIGEGGTAANPVEVPTGCQVGGLIGRTYNVYGHVTNCLIAGTMKATTAIKTDLDKLTGADSTGEYNHLATGAIVGFNSWYSDYTQVMTHLDTVDPTAVDTDTQLHFNTILTSLEISNMDSYLGGTRDFPINAATSHMNRVSWGNILNDSTKKNASGQYVWGFRIDKDRRLNDSNEVQAQGAGSQTNKTTLQIKDWDYTALTSFWHRWRYSEDIGYPVPNEVVKNLLKDPAQVNESGAGYQATTEFRTSLNASADATTGTNIDWYTGDKTEYTLTTAAQLRGFFQLRRTSEKVENGTDANGETVYKTVYPNTFEGVTIKLGCDMNVDTDLSAIPSASIFMGTFDGQGHVISGLRITSNGSGMRSFFGSAAGNATVKNLSIIDSSITVNSFGVDTKGNKTGSKNAAAAIFTQIDQKPEGGNATNANVRIENVYSDTDIVFRTASITLTETDGVMNVTKVSTSGESANSSVGGFVGIAKYGTLTIKNCVSAGDITSNAHDVAGFIGQVRASVKNAAFDNCQYIGHLNPLNEMYVGGTNSNYGKDFTYDGKTYKAVLWDVSADVHSWSGFVGHLFGSGKVTLNACTNRASILDLYSRAGGFVGYMSSGGSNYLTATNCVNYGAMMTRNGSVGALIGEYQSAGGSVIANSVINKAGISSVASNAGGMIGYVSSVGGNIALENCVNDGYISALNYVGGMIGLINGSRETKSLVTVELCGCVNNGSIHAKQHAAGMVGGVCYTSAEKFNLTNCTNTGDLFITSQRAAGMIATFFGKDANLTLSGCVNSGDIDFQKADSIKDIGVFMGGMLGYVYGSSDSNSSDTVNDAEFLGSVELESCKNTGTLVANRTSGGLIGFIQRCQNLAVYNSSVDSEMKFFIDSGNNYNVGGLIGRLDLIKGNKAYIYNSTVSGEMRVYDIDIDKPNSYGGGLLGYLYSGDLIIKNSSVDMIFSLGGSCVTSADILSVFLGGKHASNATLTVSGLKYVPHGEEGDNGVNGLNGIAGSETTTAAPANIQQIGSQYRKNSNGTYDLRYVFGINSLTDIEAIGFDVNILTAENDSYNTRKTTLYCPNIYKTINADGASYDAEDFGMTYLFTLSIAGIPADRINIEEGRVYIKNSVVELTPFTQKSATASAVKAQTHYIGKKNLITYNDFDFSKTLPTGFSGDGIIPNYAYPEAGADVTKTDGCVQINGISNSALQFALKKVCTNTSATHICSPLCANGAVALADNANARYHYYIDTSVHKGQFGETLDRYGAYHKWSFTVDTAGLYDFCFQLRLKDSNTRYALIQINDQDLDEQTTLVHYLSDYTKLIASTTSTDATYRDTYVTGFSAYLEAGTNTITIRMPYNSSSSSMHFRNIFIKAAE